MLKLTALAPITIIVLLGSLPVGAMPRIFYPENPQEIEASLDDFGKRRMCLTFDEIDAVIPLRSNKAIFVTKGGISYLNNFISGCKHLLDPKGTLQFQLESARFCRNGRLNVFAPAASAPSGSCAVGDFRLIIEAPQPPPETDRPDSDGGQIED